MLKDLGVTKIHLLTNNPPQKKAELEECGITVTERVPVIISPPNASNRNYLNTKAQRMGHVL